VQHDDLPIDDNDVSMFVLEHNMMLGLPLSPPISPIVIDNPLPESNRTPNQGE
jgi:hypothetical protein